MADPLIEQDVVVALSPSVIEAQTRGEVDVQVATARRYPRQIRTFIDRALEMATLDEDTASACIYAVPRDGKTIEGPSARMAEICAAAYGHLRVSSHIVGEDDSFVTVRGECWDVQNNVAIGFESRRRITTKQGKKFSDDMRNVTANAASSIAIRNAILKVIPAAYWRPIYDRCREVAVGKADTLANRRAKMLAHFQKLGVEESRVLVMLKVKGVEDITLDHLATLRGSATAIKEGDTSVDDAFPNPRAGAAPLPPEPKGYDIWLAALRDVAAEGADAFAHAWMKSKRDFREYLAAADPRLLESLQAQATAAIPPPAE